MSNDPTTNEIASLSNTILDELERAVVGKREVLSLLLTGILADGHVLFEDLPGLAKTLIARSFAQVSTMQFSRVQFTPDLVPGDITGSMVLDAATGRGAFQPGPVFANLVLGDEINRAPPKTQAAVLEAMEERQVTVDGTSHQLPRPFLVIATQNPIESGGTYPLPEAQLDRFLMRVSVGYPDNDAETEIVMRRAARKQESVELRTIIDTNTLLAMQAAIEDVYLDPTIAKYIVEIVHATRSSGLLQVGASPRGSLGLMKVARARAAIMGRNFVTPDDVVEMAVPVLAHRVMLTPDEWLRGQSTPDVITACVASVATPPTIKPPTAAPMVIRG